jgi:uroporphyrinogen-III synthase
VPEDEERGRRQRLAGVRVLVPRPRERSEQLCFLLEDEGARVLAIPLLELEPPTDPRPLQAAAELLRRFAWVAFASERGVTALVEAARTAGTLDVLRTRKLAAVGPGTAAALGAVGLEVTLVANVSTGEGLAEALLPRLQPAEVVLLPAAEEGRRSLEEGLRVAGVTVERVAAYRSRPAGSVPEGWAEVVAHPPRCVLFGSPRTVEAFLGLPGAGALVPRVKAVAVGPTTAAALRAQGWEPAAIATAPTPPEWVEAAVQAVGG